MTKPYDLVALLAGSGTRMKEEQLSNKCFVKVGGKTMLEHMQEKISELETGGYILDNKIAVVNSSSAGEVMEALGESFKYVYQSVPDGTASAMYRAGDLVKHPFILYLGDQFYEEPLGRLVEGFQESSESARVWLKNTSEYRNHTTARFKDDYFMGFVEKPDYGDVVRPVATGLYMFKVGAIKSVENIGVDVRGERNLSDLLNNLLKNNQRVGMETMNGYWVDVGTPQKVDEAERYIK